MLLRTITFCDELATVRGGLTKMRVCFIRPRGKLWFEARALLNARLPSGRRVASRAQTTARPVRQRFFQPPVLWEGARLLEDPGWVATHPLHPANNAPQARTCRAFFVSTLCLSRRHLPRLQLGARLRQGGRGWSPSLERPIKTRRSFLRKAAFGRVLGRRLLQGRMGRSLGRATN